MRHQLRRAASFIGVSIATVAIAAFVATGSIGFFHAPRFNQTVVLPSPAATQSTPPVQPVSSQPCWTVIEPSTVQYDADVEANRFFGDSLAPASLPSVPSAGYVPSKSTIQDVVCNEWQALRRRPAQALATATVAMPQYRDYYASNWFIQLGMLADHGDWDEANLTFVDAKSPPPNVYTMGMDYHFSGANAPPLVFIAYAHITGWYLTVLFQGYLLYLRIGCGGQPNFDMQRYQTIKQYYPFSG